MLSETGGWAQSDGRLKRDFVLSCFLEAFSIMSSLHGASFKYSILWDCHLAPVRIPKSLFPWGSYLNMYSCSQWAQRNEWAHYRWYQVLNGSQQPVQSSSHKASLRFLVTMKGQGLAVFYLFLDFWSRTQSRRVHWIKCLAQWLAQERSERWLPPPPTSLSSNSFRIKWTTEG